MSGRIIFLFSLFNQMRKMLFKIRIKVGAAALTFQNKRIIKIHRRRNYQYLAVQLAGKFACELLVMNAEHAHRFVYISKAERRHKIIQIKKFGIVCLDKAILGYLNSIFIAACYPYSVKALIAHRFLRLGSV